MLKILNRICWLRQANLTMVIIPNKILSANLRLPLRMIVSVIDQSEKLNLQGHLLKAPRTSHSFAKAFGIAR